jgi:hypothetical protein
MNSVCSGSIKINFTLKIVCEQSGEILTVDCLTFSHRLCDDADARKTSLAAWLVLHLLTEL